jgi:predicted ribosome-associated RNA-binding protein Tma20
VTAVSPTSVTIKNAKGKNRVINLSATTVVDKATTGATADLVQGATILVDGKATADGSFDAAEIIVLPPGSKFAASSG